MKTTRSKTDDRVRVDGDQHRVSHDAHNFLEQRGLGRGIVICDLFNEILDKYFKEDGHPSSEGNSAKLRRMKLETGLNSRRLFDKILKESFPDEFATGEKFLLSIDVVKETYNRIKIIEKLSGASISSLSESAFDLLFEDEGYRKALDTHTWEGNKAVKTHREDGTIIERHRPDGTPISSAIQKKIDKEKKAMDILDPTGELRAKADKLIDK